MESSIKKNRRELEKPFTVLERAYGGLIGFI
jgi:hypothetical protein